MIKKKAIIFGISGQDGSFLANYLLGKNYSVIGISRKRKNFTNHKQLKINNKIKIISMDYQNKLKLKKIILNSKCNEIYFFAGQSKPSISKKFSLETLETNTIPVFYILEIIRKYKSNIKFFNASSCEIFKPSKLQLKETSKKEPNTIYGLSKLVTYEIVKFYREKFKLKACSGIFFQHESILRKKDFVIIKIIDIAKKIKTGKEKFLYLGNIIVKKDWGWTPEYMEVVHKIMKLNNFDDFIIATGKSTKLKDVVKKVFNFYGLEVNKHLKIDNKLKRKMDILSSESNISKIKKKLNWRPKIFIDDVINKIINKQLY